MSVDSQFFQAVLRYPPSWIVVLSNAAAVAGFFAWFEPSPAMSVAALTLGLGLIAVWLLLLAADARFHHSYHRLATRIDQDDLGRLFQLEQHLRGHGPLGEHGAATLHRLRDSFDALTRIFVRRLHGGELIYGRYLAAAEQLLLFALDHAEAALARLSDPLQSPGAAAPGTAALTEAERRLAINQRIELCFDALTDGLTRVRGSKAYATPELRPRFDELEQLVSTAKTNTKTVRRGAPGNAQGER